MLLRLITPPAAEPLSLAELKADLRVDHSDHDASLTRFLAEARSWVERRTQRAFLTQTWEAVLDVFPRYEIELPLLPVQSITSVKYDDVDDVEQTLVLDTDYRFANGRVYPVEAWPSTFAQGSNTVRIRFVAGYATAAEIPRPLISAVRLKVTELYEGAPVGAAINSLLENYIQITA
jgi:uncharacterized phiE125 gp8 family phage protein